MFDAYSKMQISLLSDLFLFYVFALSFIDGESYCESSLLATLFWYAISNKVGREFFIVSRL